MQGVQECARKCGVRAEIGRRAWLIHRRRGLSLDVVAGLAGISKGYLSMLETGKRRLERRGLLDDFAGALGCSVVDLTGQPYLPADRDTADALATLPGISLAINDCILDDVPDLPVRPLEQLVVGAAEANEQLDAARFSLAGRGLGALLTELHVTAATGGPDTQRAALAALAEACLVGASVARHLGTRTSRWRQLGVATTLPGGRAIRRAPDCSPCTVV